MNGDPRFRETQRFRQGWLWAFLLVTNVPILILLGVVFADEYGGLTPEAIRVGGLTLLALVLPLVLIHRAALVTEVRDDGVYLKFFPFHLRFRRIPFGEIEAVEAAEYSAMRDYGGWGIRWGVSLTRNGLAWDEKGKAYIVDGSEGVRLERDGGRPLLVGSERADELRRAIEDGRRY
ncbi:hypothetical protein [Haladaptatus sp. T7]|uniref:hypothetical protein n=1 Tax=Haladaptatus sp. T7 TaxID=2029368 RepID=UPI0021A25626|nr:hypothetical protein [Haladaptatus sp. T7]GKZ13979.1 hypothetical protein HAL_18600 [Haladaptatus sp. T7]